MCVPTVIMLRICIFLFVKKLSQHCKCLNHQRSSNFICIKIIIHKLIVLGSFMFTHEFLKSFHFQYNFCMIYLLAPHFHSISRSSHKTGLNFLAWKSMLRNRIYQLQVAFSNIGELMSICYTLVFIISLNIRFYHEILYFSFTAI